MAYSIKELEETVRHYKKKFGCGKGFSRYYTNPVPIKEKIDMFLFVNFCMAVATQSKVKSQGSTRKNICKLTSKFPHR